MSLVLTRRPGESFKIGDDITVTIGHGWRNNQVRVLVDAPKHIKILRTELVDYAKDQPKEGNT